MDRSLRRGTSSVTGLEHRTFCPENHSPVPGRMLPGRDGLLRWLVLIARYDLPNSYTVPKRDSAQSLDVVAISWQSLGHNFITRVANVHVNEIP